MQTFCDKHAGHVENIRELCEFKRKLDGDAHGIGELERMWQSIGKKVSRGTVIGFTVLIITVVSGLFGLVYQSNSKVLHEMVSIKTTNNLILEKLK